MSYHTQFLRVTQQKLSDIRRRSQEKRDKRGRVLRMAIAVEFTLEQFRTWVLSIFGDEAGAAPCSYCGRWLTVANFVPDHDVPLNRGGRNTTDNLRVACEDCNDLKGELSGKWFAWLLKVLAQMPMTEAQIIRERLKKAEKLASSVRNLRAVNRKLQFSTTEENVNA